MRKTAAGERVIRYAQAHHHVLPAWVRYRRLIWNACLITIALEPGCVLEPKIDRKVSASRLFERMKREIAAA